MSWNDRRDVHAGHHAHRLRRRDFLWSAASAAAALPLAMCSKGSSGTSGGEQEPLLVGGLPVT
jgi:hypothetical protein